MKLKQSSTKEVLNRNLPKIITGVLLLIIVIINPQLTAGQSKTALEQKLSNKKSRVDAAFKLSVYYLQQNQKDEALKYARQAVAFAEKSSDKEQLETINQLAKVYATSNLFDSAVYYYQAALQFITDSNQFYQQQIKVAHNLKADFKMPEAETIYLLVLKWFLQHKQTQQASEISNYLGSLFWSNGLYDKAILWYDSALVLNSNQNFEGTILNNKALCYKEIGDFNRAKGFHRKALEVAIKRENKLKQASTFNYLGSIYLGKNQYDSANLNYLKSYIIYHSVSDTAGILHASANLAKCYYNAQLYDSAIVWNQRALKYTTESSGEQLIKLKNNLGDIYNQTGNYKAAVDYYLQSLRSAILLNDLNMQAQTYNRLAQLYTNLNNFEKSTYYLEQSINISKQINTPNQLAYKFHMMGNLQFQFENYNGALEFYNQALKIRNQGSDSLSIAQTLNSIGTCYQKLGNNKKAESYFQNARKIYEQINDPVRLSYVYNNMGNNELDRNNNKLANDYFTKAYTLSKSFNNAFIEGLTARKLGEYELKNNNIPKAEAYFKESLEVGQQTNHSLLQQNALYQLYLLNKQNNNPEKALEYYALFTEKEKQAIAEKNSRKIYETQLNYLLQLKSDTIKYIEDELVDSKQKEKIKSIEAQQLRAQRRFLLFLVLISIIAITAILILFLQNQRKKHLLRKAYIKQREAHLKLKKSEAVLKELNATKDKFFSIIGHDLRGPISGLMNLTGILNDNHDDFTSDELREANENIHQSSKSLYALLENLLNWARTQTGKISFTPADLSLSPLIAETISALQISAKDKNIALINEVNPTVNVFGDREMIKTIIRNLMSNSIKFTPNNGSIKISATSENNIVQINVTDTGVGMSDDIKNKLFKVDEQVTTLGTNKESGTGLGLVLCKEFIKKHRGKIWVESTPEIGSTFSFTLNYKNND